MYCSSCGNQLIPDSHFCNKCGTPITNNTVEVVGNVAVDNSTKLDNLYKLARRARDEKNDEKAAQYYEQILLESPNNWEPAFYSIYYSAIQKCYSGEIVSTITLLENSLDNIICYIKEIKDNDKLKAAAKEVSERISIVASELYEVISEDWIDNSKNIMKIPTGGFMDLIRKQKMFSDNDKEKNARQKLVDDMYNSLQQKLENHGLIIALEKKNTIVTVENPKNDKIFNILFFFAEVLLLTIITATFAIITAKIDLISREAIAILGTAICCIPMLVIQKFKHIITNNKTIVGNVLILSGVIGIIIILIYYAFSLDKEVRNIFIVVYAIVSILGLIIKKLYGSFSNQKNNETYKKTMPPVEKGSFTDPRDNNPANFFDNYLERVKVHFGHHLIAYKKSGIQSNNNLIAKNTQMIQFAGAMGYQMRAFAYVGNGDLNKAIADIDAAIREIPDNGLFYLCRGAVYGEKGDFDKAIADFDTALKLKPDAVNSYYYRSLAYLGKGNFDRAFADCDKALTLNLSKAEQLDAYLIRGFLYGRNGDFDKAIMDFETALQIRLDKVKDGTIDIEPDFHNNAREYLKYALATQPTKDKTSENSSIKMRNKPKAKRKLLILVIIIVIAMIGSYIYISYISDWKRPKFTDYIYMCYTSEVLLQATSQIEKRICTNSANLKESYIPKGLRENKEREK